MFKIDRFNSCQTCEQAQYVSCLACPALVVSDSVCKVKHCSVLDSITAGLCGLLCFKSTFYMAKMPPKSNVHCHFNMPSSSSGECKSGNLTAVCRHCKKAVAGSNKATSNFRRHLEVSIVLIY